MSKVPAPERDFIPAKHHGGAQKPTLLVIHAAVTSYKKGAALGVANYFKQGSVVSSAHFVSDEAEDYQCVAEELVAYHCGYNSNSVSFEMCIIPLKDSVMNWFKPKSEWTGGTVEYHGEQVKRFRWLQMGPRKVLKRTARLVAQSGLAHDIPLKFLTDAELRVWDLDKSNPALGGIVTHAQMTRVFKKSTHWDPGAWPDKLFLRYVNRYKRRLLKKYS